MLNVSEGILLARFEAGFGSIGLITEVGMVIRLILKLPRIQKVRIMVVSKNGGVENLLDLKET